MAQFENLEDSNSRSKEHNTNGINRTETVFAEGFIENFGIYFLK